MSETAGNGMTGRRLKVAVTGLSVSRGYIPRYAAAPETELEIVHDIDEARAREVAEQFGSPRWTVDFDEVLSSGVDILDVSTPNHVHREQAVAALGAGINVLCQKPMAPSVADCREMVAAAGASTARLGIFMTWRDSPFSADLRRIVSEGYLGKIAAVRVRNAHRGPYLLTGKDHWRAAAANIGGGSFMQLAVHGLNYALWLVGEETVSVMGYARNLHCGHSLEGEDVVASAGELESGALITMESGYSSTGNSLEIYGTEGTLMCGRRRSTEVALSRDFSGELIEYRVDGAPEHPLCVTPDDFGEEAERIAAERNGNRTFAKAILSGEPFDTPAEIGMRDVAVCQAVYRSAETGRRVRVSELIEEAGA